MSVVKSLLVQPSHKDSIPWLTLFNAEPTQLEKLNKEIRKHMSHLLDFRVVLLSLDNNLILDHFPEGTSENTTFTIPYSNIITLISTSLTILMEGYEPNILIQPLQELLKDKDIVIPKQYKTSTLMDLLTKIPHQSRNTKAFLDEYNVHGRVLWLAINALLGGSVADAWRDAFMLLQLDNAVFTDKKEIVVPILDLYRFTELVQADLNSMPTIPLMDIPYDHSENYAFGWWLNCNHDGVCLQDVVPSDTIISFSPTMRVYLFHSLKMAAVFVNTISGGPNTNTFDDIMFADNEIWRQLLVIINPAYHNEYQKKRKQEHERPATPEGEEEDNNQDTQEEQGFTVLKHIYFVINLVRYCFNAYVEFTSSQHIVIRVFLWVLFLVIGHYVVYSGFHFIWKVLTILSRRTHPPRPKTGKVD